MFCETKYVVLDGCCLRIFMSWGSQTPGRPMRHPLLSKQDTPSRKIREQLGGMHSLTLPSPKLWWYSERILLQYRRVSARWSEFGKKLVLAPFVSQLKIHQKHELCSKCMRYLKRPWNLLQNHMQLLIPMMRNTRSFRHRRWSSEKRALFLHQPNTIG